MVQHLQDLPLRLRSLGLLLQRHRLLVHHFHGVEAASVVVVVVDDDVFNAGDKPIIVGGAVAVVAKAAEVDGADVAGADATEEVEVAEGEAVLAAEGGGADGGVGEVRRTVWLDGEALRRGREELEGEAAETGAANALATHGTALG